jgi:uncharacterized protein (DUF1501 family)
MDLSSSNAYTRREFLGRGLVMASAAATIPAFIHGTAHAMNKALGSLSSLPGVPDERILVVVQLSGGNDGLNTVVPFSMSEYYRARPGIGVPERDVLRLGSSDGVGLHPQLAGFKSLYDDGLLGIVQGVGYPNPNRSHFKSMDIWHTADTTATGDGWIGKYIDSECCGFGKGESGTPERPDGASGPPSLAIGRTAPLAMQGRLVTPVAFENADLFRWSGQEIHKSLREPYDDLNRRGDEQAERKETNAAFLLRTSLDAQVSSDMIRKAVAQRSQVQYPGNDLGRQLAMVSSMIRAGLKTRVYYVQLGGFDTHAGQGGAQGRHGQLLSQVGGALRAFYTDLKQQGNDQRVLTLSFSEFGRRVAQNASGGTDHGTAAPMFLVGPMAKPGVLSKHPTLSDLDDGDLKYLVDFRSVYAAVLSDWLKADSKEILGKSYQAAPVIKKA